MVGNRFQDVIASVMLTEARKKSIVELAGEADLARIREFRLDPFGKRLTDGILVLNDMPEELNRKTTILTLCSKEQDGSEVISLPDQYYFWDNMLPNISRLVADPNSNVFLDLGLDLLIWMEKHSKGLQIPWDKIGVSFHDFVETGSRESLTACYESMARMKAGAFIKFITTAKNVEDIPRLFELFERHIRTGDQRTFTAFLMGELGKQSRIDCVRHGSGTYGYLPNRQTAAPGQFPYPELMVNPDINKWLELKVA